MLEGERVAGGLEAESPAPEPDIGVGLLSASARIRSAVSTSPTIRPCVSPST